MELREAIEKLTMWHQANPRTGPLGVVMDAAIDGTLIPADAMFQVKEGYEVGAAKVDADGNLQRIAEFSEALQIRSADDVRREALEESIKQVDKVSVCEPCGAYAINDAIHKIRALIDTPQPKAEPPHFDDWKPGISPDARINKLKPKGGDDV